MDSTNLALEPLKTWTTSSITITKPNVVGHLMPCTTRLSPLIAHSSTPTHSLTSQMMCQTKHHWGQHKYMSSIKCVGRTRHTKMVGSTTTNTTNSLPKSMLNAQRKVLKLLSNTALQQRKKSRMHKALDLIVLDIPPWHELMISGTRLTMSQLH